MLFLTNNWNVPLSAFHCQYSFFPVLLNGFSILEFIRWIQRHKVGGFLWKYLQQVMKISLLFLYSVFPDWFNTGRNKPQHLINSGMHDPTLSKICLDTELNMSYFTQLNAFQVSRKEQEGLFEMLALFLFEYLWELKEIKEIIKIFKYPCLLKFVMKMTRKERTTVYFTFQTFPDTYHEIHLTKRNKISVLFFMFSDCSEVRSLADISFLQWHLSRQPALENTSLCGAQLVQLPHARALQSYSPSHHPLSSRERKKWTMLRLCGLSGTYSLKCSDAHLVREFLSPI